MNALNNFFQECLLHALIAAKKAGEAILSVYQEEIDVRYKDDKTPLTLADEKAHSIVFLQTKRPTPLYCINCPLDP